MSFLLKFIFQLSKPIAVITVPLIFAKCSILISLYTETHIVWDSINNSVRDVRKAITKTRMLTGTYMIQTLKSKFNQAEVDPTCPICRLETETMTHVITSCPVLNGWHDKGPLMLFQFHVLGHHSLAADL
jgi:hypothetical protein